jgi:hypothetical protein
MNIKSFFYCAFVLGVHSSVQITVAMNQNPVPVSNIEKARALQHTLEKARALQLLPFVELPQIFSSCELQIIRCILSQDNNSKSCVACAQEYDKQLSEKHARTNAARIAKQRNTMLAEREVQIITTMSFE